MVLGGGGVGETDGELTGVNSVEVGEIFVVGALGIEMEWSLISWVSILQNTNQFLRHNSPGSEATPPSTQHTHILS